MTARILWVGKYPPLPSQHRDLAERFGHGCYKLVQLPMVRSVEEVVSEARTATEVIAMLPLSMLRELCAAGVHPLWPEMLPTEPGRGEVVIRGRPLRFARFRRLKGVEMQFEDETGGHSED